VHGVQRTSPESTHGFTFDGPHGYLAEGKPNAKTLCAGSVLKSGVW